MSRVWAGLGVAVLLVALAGCRASAPPGGGAAAGTCLGPTPASAAAPAVPASAAAPAQAAGVVPVPDLALPCFDGSGTVHMRQLAGPAVVNLWASWCQPCLAELPAFQRFAERAGARVPVVGVNTSDDHGRAESVIDDLRLTFPMLYDERKQLLTGVDRTALPATLFIAADGRIAHIHNAAALDDATLAALIGRHLGLAVP